MAETVKIVMGGAYGGLALNAVNEGNFVFLFSAPLILIFAFFVVKIANVAAENVPPAPSPENATSDMTADGLEVREVGQFQLRQQRDERRGNQRQTPAVEAETEA